MAHICNPKDFDDVSEIISNLYLSGITATQNIHGLKERKISHIITLDISPPPALITENFQSKFVPGVDMETTDLLSYFDECADFIDKGLSSGAVLVHCVMGVSRSSTIIIAYLMKKKGLDFKAALELVRNKRPVACPNDGFKKQLMEYQAMGCTVDINNEQYRHTRLRNLANRMQIGGQDLENEDLLDPEKQNIADDSVFKCKKCRQLLFKRSGILKHHKGEGEVAFDWRGKQSLERNIDSRPYCNESLFIEPVKWMKNSINVPEGKILCPKCSTKLGSFAWYGEPCSCGAWVTPAFHIQNSKVDEMKSIVLPGRQTST